MESGKKEVVIDLQENVHLPINEEPQIAEGGDRNKTPQKTSSTSSEHLQAKPIKESPKSRISENLVKEINYRAAERFFLKKTKRCLNFSNLLKIKTKNPFVSILDSLKAASNSIDKAMKKKGFKKSSQKEKSIPKPDEFYLGPKIPSEPEEEDKFSKPKFYQCGYCVKKLFSLISYFKHIRKHKHIIRCSGCDGKFNHIVQKRSHQRRCPFVIKTC